MLQACNRSGVIYLALPFQLHSHIGSQEPDLPLFLTQSGTSGVIIEISSRLGILALFVSTRAKTGPGNARVRVIFEIQPL